MPQIVNVVLQSVADKHKIKKGDYIVAVQNRLTGYMSMPRVCDLILKSKTGEIIITIKICNMI